jgi:hypothetical protein
MAKWWQGVRGCGSKEPRQVYSDSTLDCSMYCEGGARTESGLRAPFVLPGGRRALPVLREAGLQVGGGSAGSPPPLKLCAMKGVGHDLNSPYQGYAFDIAWEFLKQQAGMP